MAAKVETITEILENIKEIMCDRYCKYPTTYKLESNGDFIYDDPESPCNNCPLNYL